MLAPLYIEPTENEIEAFLKKYDMKMGDFDGDNLNSVLENNKDLFCKIVEVFDEDIKVIEKF